MSILLGASPQHCEPTIPIEYIAERFSAAAKSYQEHNSLQRLSASSLLKEFSARGTVLDIGAGPGTCFDVDGANLQVYALDIAFGMLQQLKHSFPQYQCICGSAEQLPFVNACIDSIYSNLVLQWCADFPAAVAEMARVIKPNGECHLSIVADGSLEQLLSLDLRINRFLSLDTLKVAFDPQLWQVVEFKLVPMTVHFKDLKSLLYSIKGVGASVLAVTATEQTDSKVFKLRGRKDWLRLQLKAEAFRQAEGLPLTYQIVQIRARRKHDSTHD